MALCVELIQWGTGEMVESPQVSWKRYKLLHFAQSLARLCIGEWECYCFCVERNDVVSAYDKCSVVFDYLELGAK